MRRSDPPDFHRLESRQFEEMCCALLSCEFGVTRADLYMSERKAQYGIDIIGETEDGPIVISCKVSSRIGKFDIATWSDDFLKHWSAFWKPKGIIKFILAVTQAVNSKERAQDFDREKERFTALGLEYDIWAPRQLQEKLRPHRGIVAQYCGNEYIERICGRDATGQLAVPMQASSSDLQDEIAALQAALHAEVEGELATAIDDLENGDVSQVEDYVMELQSSITWARLTSELRARVIRVRANVALSRGRTNDAEELQREADAIGQQDEPRLAANIALFRDGPVAARTVLGTPISDKGRSLLAGILLGENNVAGAEEVLAAFVEADTPEYLRLRAFCALVRAQVSHARTLIDRAEQRAPRKRAIQRLRAIVQYAQALSPFANSTAFFQPQPVARALVRRDDASQAELKRAAETFAAHAASEEQPIVRHYMRLWYLAALCNLEDAVDEAQSQLDRVLNENPTDAVAIGWALSRGMVFDETRSRDALMAELVHGTIDANGPRVLTWLVQPNELASIRNLARACIEAHKLDPDTVSALEDLIDGAPVPGLHHTEVTDLGAITDAIRDKDWVAIETLFERYVTRSPMPPESFMLAEQLAMGGRWELVYRHRQSILAFETTDAATLVVTACINTDHIDEAQTLLTATRHFHPRGRLPFKLQRFEARTHLRRGDLHRALSEFRRLSTETNDPADKIFEAHALIQIGDWRNAAPLLLNVIGAGTLDARSALIFARRLIHDDHALAVRLLRYAVNRPLADEIAPAAIEIAARLGIDPDSPELFAALPRLVKQGKAVRFVDVEEAIQIFRQQHQSKVELWRRLTHGQVPSHLFSAATNASFADLYDITRYDNEPPHAMFIRSGARPLVITGSDSIGTWSITIDPAGLIIAHQLGLLEVLEGFDNAINISPSTINALSEIEESCRHHQPARIQHLRAVSAFLDQHADTRRAAPDNAIRIAYSDDYDVVAPVHLVASLIDAQWLSEDEGSKALSRLEKAGTARRSVPLGSNVIAAIEALEELVRVGLLNVVASAFKIHVDPKDFETLKTELRDVDRRIVRADRIAALRARLHDGLFDGRYRLLGANAGHSDAATDEDEINESNADQTETGGVEIASSNRRRSHLEKSLSDCMAGPHDSTTRVWIDDRLISGFPRIGTIPTIGVVDVLVALRSDGHLSETAFFERLTKLRAGGALFIPIEPEEVLGALANAPLSPHGAIIETPRLATIRRNLALALSFGNALKLRPFEGLDIEPADEHPYIASVRSLAESVISAIWSGDADRDRAAALSDWVWSSLRVDVLPLPADRPSLRATVVALGASNLIMGSWQIHAPRGPFLERRKDYLVWVNSRIQGRLGVDRELLNQTAEITRTHLSRILDSLPADGPKAAAFGRRIIRATLAPLFGDLRDAIISDPEFRRKLALPIFRTVVIVDRQHFEPYAFWRAASRAWNYSQSKLRSLDANKRATVQRNGGRLVLRIAKSRRRNVLDDPALALLSRNADQRRAAIEAELLSLRVWPKAIDAEAAKVADATSPNERMAALSAVRETTPTWRFQMLSQALQQGSNIERDRFDPPEACVWLEYLGWQRDGWRAAIARVADAFGPAEALHRYSGMPLDLPTDVLGSPKPIEAWPLSPFDAIYNLRALPADCDQSLLERAFDTTVDRLVRFGALAVGVLRWAHRTFEHQIGWRDLPAAEKLVTIWTYAGIMLRTVVEAGSSPSHALEMFKRLAPTRDPANFLWLERGIDDSVLSPTNQSAPSIFLAGLEYALAEKLYPIGDDPDRAKLLGEFLTTANDKLGGPLPLQSYWFLADQADTWLARPFSRKVFTEGPIGDELLIQTANKLVDDPYAATSWIFAAGTAGASVAPETKNLLLRAAEKVDVAELITREDGHHALRAFASLMTLLFDQATRDRLLKEVSAAIAAWARSRDRSDAEDDAQTIMETAGHAAKSFDASGQERFSDILMTALLSRPDLAPYFRKTAERMIYSASIARSERIWALVNDLRAR